MKKFEHLFFIEENILTITHAIQYEIKTTTDQQTNSELYRYPSKHEAEVRRQISEMEAQRIIQKSCSKHASPLIVVPTNQTTLGYKNSDWS